MYNNDAPGMYDALPTYDELVAGEQPKQPGAVELASIPEPPNSSSPPQPLTRTLSTPVFPNEREFVPASSNGGSAHACDCSISCADLYGLDIACLFLGPMILAVAMLLLVWRFGDWDVGIIVSTVVFPFGAVLIVVALLFMFRACNSRLCESDEVDCMLFLSLLMLAFISFLYVAVTVGCVFLPFLRGIDYPHYVGPVPDLANENALALLRDKNTRFFKFETSQASVGFSSPLAVDNSLAATNYRRVRSKTGFYTVAESVAPIVSAVSRQSVVYACGCTSFNGCRIFPSFNVSNGLGRRAWSRSDYSDAVRISSRLYQRYCAKAGDLMFANYLGNITRSPGGPVDLAVAPSDAVYLEFTSFPLIRKKIKTIVLGVVLAFFSAALLVCLCTCICARLFNVT